ncbi:MAG: DUF2203 domain-containing protein [Polyangiaceae bacterium]|nr:DUF2203 domain-containing protein [Polyangiaceae bacterium]
MPAPHVFTLEEANALLPRLSALIEAQSTRRTAIEERLEQLARRLGGLPEAIQIEAGDPPDVRALKEDIIARVEAYQAAWRDVESLGAVLKDARQGLLDFFGHVDGKAVWLCWKYGETAVTHYHGLDEGFAGRKAIPPAMRRHMLN